MSRSQSAARHAATIVVTVVVTTIAIRLAPGTLVPPVIDEGALQESVRLVLRDELASTTVTAVDCPAELSVVEGDEFVCSFSFYDETFYVPVEFTDDEGSYRVGEPLEQD